MHNSSPEKAALPAEWLHQMRHESIPVNVEYVTTLLLPPLNRVFLDPAFENDFSTLQQVLHPSLLGLRRGISLLRGEAI
jgi:hypothetical protein